MYNSKVVLSLEQSFSPAEQDEGQDLWIIGTESNIEIARQLRASNSFPSVTVFHGRERSKDTVLSMLPTVLEHHPRTDCILIRGIPKKIIDEIVDEPLPLWRAKADGDVIAMTPARP